MRALLAPLVLIGLLSLCYADNLVVTCGSTIKLQHVATKSRLHSHQVSYSRGSGQQSVTGYPDGDDGNSLWLISGPADEPCVPGSPMKKGAKLRLQHTATRKWLHSHHYESPLSANQEVSAFGGEGTSDGGDVWTVDWDGKVKVWKQLTKVRLRHVDTQAYLSAHDLRFGNPIAGQYEVYCGQYKGKAAEWQAAEGVYLPQPVTDGDAEALPAADDEL